jgi:hypothetical protein
MLTIITLLAPLFLCATGGDIYFARAAAFETVHQYRPRNHVDLIIIAQIIGGGLAGVGSISLAANDTLSMAMALRLRANAAALFRVTEQARRALLQACADDDTPKPPVVPYAQQDAYEAQRAASREQKAQNEESVIAEVAVMQGRAAEALVSFETDKPAVTVAAAPLQTHVAQPKATPDQTTRTNTASRKVSDAEWRSRWASAMTDVANEFTADLDKLPPAERDLAIQRTNILNNVAKQLLSGGAPPGLRAFNP